MEARIDAKHAEYKTEIAMLAKELTERENRMLRVNTSLAVAALGIGIAVLKFL